MSFSFVASRPRHPFLEGCLDSIPICISFAFLFFSCGSLCTAYGYRPIQAVSMKALIFASPLQIFIAQNGDTLSLAALALASLLINFRFVIMASALSDKLRSVSLAKLLISIPLLTASTFMLSNHKGDRS